MQTRDIKGAPAATGAVRGLGRRLTLSYWLFTSLTLALLLGALMSVAFLAQWESGDLYRMAYSDQVNVINDQMAWIRTTGEPGSQALATANARQWFSDNLQTRGTFTSDVYGEFVAPDGTVLARTESPAPEWTRWTRDPNFDSTGVYVLNGAPPVNIRIIDRQRVESDNEVKSSSGRLLGRLNFRFRFVNMWLLYWAAGGVVWLILSATALILGAVFGRWSARPLSKRLATITAAADRWAQGDFSLQLKDKKRDEIGYLSGRLNMMSEQLQALMASRQALATTDERQRLARELHDSVKQQVFATSMQLGAVAMVLPDGENDARKLLRDAQLTIQATHAELASMIFALRPAALKDRGLTKALGDLVEGWRLRDSVSIELALHGACAVPMDVEDAFFRVAQEAIANAMRHSQARHIVMTLRCDSETATLSVRDDGVGFDPQGEHGGLGLTSMRSRMNAVHGELAVHSAPSDGVEVVAVWRSKQAA